MRAMRSLGHRVSWLMAEKSFDKPIIGPLATFIGAVPVSRAMDNTKAGIGKVYLSKRDANVLVGIGTNFESPEFQIGGSIYLPSVNREAFKLDVAEVRGPEEILLKTAPTRGDILDQLSRPEGMSFKVAARIDQTAVYNAVFERLSRAGCIGIFPEGGSHDRPDLLPLKGIWVFLTLLKGPS
jgi:glycerol-3-phosphate O-acyltransferase / dihydroxyacetone phosphate acyltransferase